MDKKPGGLRPIELQSRTTDRLTHTHTHSWCWKTAWNQEYSMDRGRHQSFSLAWFHRQGGKTGASEDQGAPSCREGGSHPQSPHQVNSVSQGISDALKHLQPQPLPRARAVERDKANAQIPLGSPGAPQGLSSPASFLFLRVSWGQGPLPSLTALPAC